MYSGGATIHTSHFRKYREDGKKAVLTVKESSNVQNDWISPEVLYKVNFSAIPHDAFSLKDYSSASQILPQEPSLHCPFSFVTVYSPFILLENIFPSWSLAKISDKTGIMKTLPRRQVSDILC